MPDDQRRSRGVAGRHRITVLGSFTLTDADGATCTLGVDARRLVAYLAVHPREQERAALAGDLWPGVAPAAAARLLADAVAAIDVPGLLRGVEGGPLALAPEVEVDLAEAMALVRALPELPLDAVAVALLTADVLPGWTAAWIAVERERFRQLRLHAIEELSARLSAAQRHEEAVAVAERAVRSAPSRESARRALIEAHLAAGDVAAAVGAYDEYQELLRSSVGGPLPTGLETVLPPSPVLPVLRARPAGRGGVVLPRSAVVLPGLRSVRGAGGGRRLVAGGSVPGAAR